MERGKIPRRRGIAAVLRDNACSFITVGTRLETTRIENTRGNMGARSGAVYRGMYRGSTIQLGGARRVETARAKISHGGVFRPRKCPVIFLTVRCLFDP